MRLSEFNISEVVDNAIAEHIKRGVPFTECMFRPGSEAFTMFYRAVREMREDIDMDWFDREMLDTDIGECVEIDGEIVPLDVPIEDLTEGRLGFGDLEKLGRANASKIDNEARRRGSAKMSPGDADQLRYKIAKEMGLVEGGMPSIVIKSKQRNAEMSDEEFASKFKDIPDDELRSIAWRHGYGKGSNYYVNKRKRGLGEQVVDEAEYQGKKVKLNSPKRGGPKKYYVYTKNKKGNVIKVSWGDTTGLKTKANNPGAVKSFVARHDCKNKKDKTKAGYWACRTPRYKSLGVKGGQWW